MTTYLTDQEAGERVRKSAATVARWRRERGLRFVPGRPCLIDLADLEAFMAMRKTSKWKTSKPTPAVRQSRAGMARQLLHRRLAGRER